MENKQILKNDILVNIDKIGKSKTSDNIEVKEIFSELTARFNNLNETDFINKIHYEIYQKGLKLSSIVYNMEIEALINQEDYATSDNFFQIKMSLIGYLGWLDKNY